MQVRRVLAARSHYEKLGVPSTASREVVKKAFRDLALQIHSDRNGSPRADEAFKVPLSLIPQIFTLVLIGTSRSN